MASCSVNGCRSNQRQKENETIKFHHFPEDKIVQQKWIDVCCRKTPTNVKYARICSLHFEPTAYKRQMIYELLALPVPRNQCVLKKDAVPTLNLPKLPGTYILTNVYILYL